MAASPLLCFQSGKFLSSPRMRVSPLAALAGCLWLVALPAPAEVINADPSNYRALLRGLKPGDTLNLASGRYPRLYLTGLNGTPDAWITITGPPSGPPAVIAGEEGYNTIEILNSSFLAIETLRIDSHGIPGAFGISAKDGEANRVHNIRIEGNTFVGQNGGQGTVGISTKTPTWGWVIRYNRILGAGTGLYLGHSDGSLPFVAGLIEHNLVKDTIGYNLEIKHQNSIPAIEGMPTGPTSTIIRNNVFIKNDQPSPDGDRPNVLVGGFPPNGAGSLNLYEVYGNYFLHNHREALFQASGRVSLHDNVFVDGPYSYPAVVLMSHVYPLKIAYVYHNTVYTSGRGIHFGTRALIDDAVAGNLIFALTPLSGTIMRQSGNTVDSTANAAAYVKLPSFTAGEMDFYPLPGKCQGAPLDLSLFHTDTDYHLDFNGTPKTQGQGMVVFRGAYAGEADNPGWTLQADIKFPRPPAPSTPPVLVWMEPGSGQAGTTVAVTLTGAGFTPEATVSAGSGVTVSDVMVKSPTQITASVAIAGGALAGIRELTVQQASGSSNALPFRVNSRAGTDTTEPPVRRKPGSNRKSS